MISFSVFYWIFFFSPADTFFYSLIIYDVQTDVCLSIIGRKTILNISNDVDRENHPLEILKSVDVNNWSRVSRNPIEGEVVLDPARVLIGSAIKSVGTSRD